MRYLALIVLLCIFGCSRSEPVPEPTIFNPNLINGVNDSEEEPTTVHSDSVVFLGDSLTHIGWWRSYFPDAQTANQGIGGNTTIQVLDRLDPILEPKPNKIFLLIGANDYNFGVAPFIIASNYEKIIKRIRSESPETKLYVQTIMPYGPKVRDYFPMIPSTYKNDIIELNYAIAFLADINGCVLLNTYAVMVNENGNLKDGFTLDQIHLEKPGYDAWVQFLDPFVRE